MFDCRKTGCLIFYFLEVLFFSNQGVPPCFKRNKQISYLFQRNLHKGMPHCPQGIPWSLRVQLLIEEYSFKIMFDFLQEILCLFKGQIHGVILHFRAETSPPFKGIAIYIIHTVYIYVYI